MVRALKFPLIIGRRYSGKTMIGRQPNSGNPTARDERRASRKRDVGLLFK